MNQHDKAPPIGDAEPAAKGGTTLLGRKRHVMDELTPMDQAAGAIIGLGALNWGLVGLANFDPIGAIFGRRSRASRLAYSMIGASAAYIAARGIAQNRD